MNFAECSNQASICIEHVDAACQVAKKLCEVCVQTDEYKDASIEIGGYDEGQTRRDTDSCSSRYYESSDNTDLETCEKSHKRIIIQKDSEIIVLKNELGVRSDAMIHGTNCYRLP